MDLSFGLLCATKSFRNILPAADFGISFMKETFLTFLNGATCKIDANKYNQMIDVAALRLHLLHRVLIGLDKHSRTIFDDENEEGFHSLLQK